MENPQQFSKWFGESKVVDAHGEPLVVFHGSINPDPIGIFDPHNTVTRSFGGVFNKVGTWFSHLEEYARGYAGIGNPYGQPEGRVYPVYLSIENPYVPQRGYDGFKNSFLKITGLDHVVDAQQVHLDMFNDWLSDRDGIILKNFSGDSNIIDSGEPQDVYIARFPEQIKSVDNPGSWDILNPDILDADPVLAPEPDGIESPFILQ